MIILIFLIILFILVLVHEWGHFIVAKKTGMRVDEFGIGFPPKLKSIWRGETEYSLNLLPLGGFVRIFGEDGAGDKAEDKDSAATTEANGERPEAEEPGTEDNQAQLLATKEAAADFGRSFTSKTKLQQAAVLIAGVTMNVVLAWFIFFIVLMIGEPVAVADEAAASEEARLVVAAVKPESPAAALGIPIGATVTGLNAADGGEQILLPSTFREFTAGHGGEPITIDYKFGDQVGSATVTPEFGLIKDEPERAAIGVVLSLIDTVRVPFYIAWYDALIRTMDGLVLVTVSLGTFFSDMVIGQADYDQVAGPVGIVSLIDDALSFGLTSLLILTAYLSLSLAVINLLPFPALDGGRLVMVGIETLIGRPLNPVWVRYVNTMGFVLLLLLMVLITYNDINKLI